ncbi:MAG: sialidase family protein [Actinomycetota bacterium]
MPALLIVCAVVSIADPDPQSAVRGRRSGHAFSFLDLGRSDAAVLQEAAGATKPRPAVAHRAGGKPVGDRSRKPPTVRLYRTGYRAAEPTLAITKKGWLFYEVVPPTGPRGAGKPEVLRSKDGGASWEEVSPEQGGLEPHQNTLDPFIYADPWTSRIFTVDLAYPCSITSFSDDGGESWTTTFAPCGESDHQNIFAGPPVHSTPVDYPNLVYYCAIQAGVTAMWSAATQCVKSLDGGITYVPTGSPPYTDQPQEGRGELGIAGHCGGGTGHGVVDAEGVVYLPRGWCGQPYLAISADEGMTWRRAQVSDKGMRTFMDIYPDHEAGVAVDRDGTIYYTWVAQDGLPYLAISEDGGESFGSPLMVGAPGVRDASLPSIDVDIDNPGKVALLYMGTRDGSAWNGYITATSNVLAKRPLFYSVTAKPLAEPLMRGQCPPISCGPQYDFLDVVFGPDGAIWGTFVDGCPLGKCDQDQTVSGRPAGEGVLAKLVGI